MINSNESSGGKTPASSRSTDTDAAEYADAFCRRLARATLVLRLMERPREVIQDESMSDEEEEAQLVETYDQLAKLYGMIDPYPAAHADLEWLTTVVASRHLPPADA